MILDQTRTRPMNLCAARLAGHYDDGRNFSLVPSRDAVYSRCERNVVCGRYFVRAPLYCSLKDRRCANIRCVRVNVHIPVPYGRTYERDTIVSAMRDTTPRVKFTFPPGRCMFFAVLQLHRRTCFPLGQVRPLDPSPTAIYGPRRDARAAHFKTLIRNKRGTSRGVPHKPQFMSVMCRLREPFQPFSRGPSPRRESFMSQAATPRRLAFKKRGSFRGTLPLIVIYFEVEIARCAERRENFYFNHGFHSVV